MPRDVLGQRTRGAALLVVLALVVLLTQFTTGFSQGPNNRNVSVDTRVNVTGSAPEILSVILDTSITLTAGSVKSIACNLTVRDYNGGSDVTHANATLFRANYSLYDVDDNNTHYTNSSCVAVATDGLYRNFTCTFDVTYYAMNGTWNCSAAVNDTINLEGRNSNTTLINRLLALNVTPLIDYGDMAMGDTSPNQQANISNLGNHPINVTVRGYGATVNDGFSFVCSVGNILIGRQKFAPNSTATYAEKQNLTISYVQVPGMSIAKATNGTNQFNTTYWQLYLNPLENVYGLCNGTIIFQAEATY